MRDLQSYLARYIPRSPTDPDQMRALRSAAWRQQGIAVLLIDEIHDDWVRRAIINEANRLYGRRQGVHHDR